MTRSIRQRLDLAQAYLNLIVAHGYSLIDLNMIEPVQVQQLEDKGNQIIFERQQQLYQVRGDWTQSLLNYNESFEQSRQKLGYYGPVIRNYETDYQAGVELYQASDQDMLDSLKLHLDFVQTYRPDLRVMIINDDSLMSAYRQRYNLPESINQQVIDKDLTALAELLGQAHPFYRLMTCPVSLQYQQIKEEFSGSPDLTFINQVEELVRAYQLHLIVDMSFRSPHPYYNGFYFQLFLDEHRPVLTGGEYGKQAFGIGIDLSQGGLL